MHETPCLARRHRSNHPSGADASSRHEISSCQPYSIAAAFALPHGLIFLVHAVCRARVDNIRATPSRSTLAPLRLANHWIATPSPHQATVLRTIRALGAITLAQPRR